MMTMCNTLNVTTATDQTLTAWQTAKALWPLAAAIGSGLLGYWIGTLTTYFEQKQRALADVVPSVFKVALGREVKPTDLDQLNRSLHLLWLYARPKTAKGVDKVLVCAKHPDPKSGGKDLIAAAQSAIVQMRKELRPWFLRWTSRLSSEDIKHFYFE
jgi:ABC-type cobalt transport system substrate-binding protein